MLVLPPNLSAVADVASGETRRYVLGSVHLRRITETEYVVEASDGKIAVKVTGESETRPTKEELPGWSDKEYGESDALISADDWKHVLKENAKRKGVPSVRNTAIMICPNSVEFVSLDGTRTCMRVDGIFPDLDAVIPKGEPSLSIKFSAKAMLQIVKCISDILGKDTILDFDFFGAGKPARIAAQSDSQKVLALILPR